jgi:hypothetical protein
VLSYGYIREDEVDIPTLRRFMARMVPGQEVCLVASKVEVYLPAAIPTATCLAKFHLDAYELSRAHLLLLLMSRTSRGYPATMRRTDRHRAATSATPLQHGERRPTAWSHG